MALGAGAVSATGFAPLSLLPVMLLCLAGWMWLVFQAPSLRRALLVGWAFGLGHFTVGNHWIQHAFTFQEAMPAWLGYIAVVLLAVYLAVWPMLAAGLAWRFRQQEMEGGYVLIFGAAWCVTEWLRATMFTGYAWNPLSVIWLPAGGVAGLAAFVGTYALSGITVALAGALLLLMQRQWRLAAALAAILVGGAILAPDAPSARADAPRVRVVQPNLGEEERPGPDYAENNLRALAALSGKAGPVPRLVVWPEGALRLLLEDGYPPYAYWRGKAADNRARVAALLGPRDVLMTGGNAINFDNAGDISSATNAVFAVDGEGRLRGRYDKAHLVPYGEYLPARPILSAIGLARLVPGDIDFAPGPGPRAINLPSFGKVGVQICYEIIFSGEIVDPAARPAVIFNPSNDAWFGFWGPPQHLAQARLRAIEEGLPVIRATPTGISAIIAADGRLLASVSADRAGAVELPVPPALPPTLFARLGNLLMVFIAGAMVFLAVAIRRARR